ncbi:hypothetical protein [Sinomonas sp. ASV322]|uniref:hypothetical protein n=1 Tax=Sinomonas sp. ASV322 TaxID=3041920 RepID=UPI0027DCB7C3|nr:hypothetical protein [Sinomonas sp. ASV322]MDQ4504621.1 hypothetical protein [Sinomonas sp. ASV322]
MSDEYPESRPSAPAWPTFPLTHGDDLAPADARKSRIWRAILGSSAVLLGLLAAFYAYTNIAAVIGATAAIEAHGGYVPQGAMTAAASIIGVFCLLAVGYVGIGTWNIIARNSTARGPLIGAIIIGAIGLILVVVNIASRSTGGTQFGSLALNVLIIVRAAVILRMKKVPAGTAAQY